MRYSCVHHANYIHYQSIRSAFANIILRDQALYVWENMMTEQTFSEDEIEAIAIVDEQLEAYNARDIDRFAATYHDDVELYVLSGGLLQPDLNGKERLKQNYGGMFSSLKYLHASTVKRIVHGRYVIIHEYVEQEAMNPDDANKIQPNYKVVAAYEVEEGLIRRVTFMW